ncbi:MAG: sigma-70 family RNA polymerase sigma factor [Phycisphaerales bacterium]
MPDHDHAHQSDGPGELPDARAVGVREDNVRTITRRFARGDQDAFAMFYQATFDNALADARRLTGRDEAFCLDAVQDAYLRAARKLPAMDSWPACRAWLRTAIASSAVDRIRADAARARREAAHARPDAAPTGNHELQALLERFEQHLDDRQWHALRLHIGQGLPLSAVGRAMSLSRHAVHGLIRRGLATLSSSLPADASPTKGDQP